MSDALILAIIFLLTVLGGLVYAVRKEPKIKPIGEIDWKDETPDYCSSFLDAVLYVANKRGIDVNKPFQVVVSAYTRNGIHLIGTKKGIAAGYIEYDPVIRKYVAVPYGAPYHYALTSVRKRDI